jgi:hypothetical protein
MIALRRIILASVNLIYRSRKDWLVDCRNKPGMTEQ